MRVGNIEVSVKLDRSPPIHTGSEDAITGNVELEFHPFDTGKRPMAKELFGPLLIKLVLEGTLRTEIYSSTTRRSSEFTYADHRNLVREDEVCFDGPFRAIAREKKRYPFAMFFPKRALLTPTQKKAGFLDDDGSWVLPGQRDCDLGEILPPSFKTRFDDRIYSSAGHASVSYALKSEITMTGIDVGIILIGLFPTIQYRSLAKDDHLPAGSNMFEQIMALSDKDFTPEAERPQSLKGKARALLKSDEETARYSFNVLCTSIPESIRVGRTFNFEVSIRTIDKNTTTATHPAVSLHECEITLIGYTRIHAFDRLNGSTQTKESSEITTVVGTTYSEGPFDKANDYSKTITSCRLPYIPNSFTVEKLSRYYRLRIALVFEIGKQKVFTRKEFPVKIYPLLSVTHEGIPPYLGPPPTFGTDDQPPPSYTEASSSRCTPHDPSEATHDEVGRNAENPSSFDTSILSNGQTPFDGDTSGIVL